MSHSENVPTGKQIFEKTAFDEAPLDPIRAINSLYRRERAYAFLNLQLNVNALDLLTQQRLYQKDENAGAIRHTMFTDCLNEEGKAGTILTLFITTESPYPVPTTMNIRHFAMSAYRVNMTTKQIANSHPQTADLDLSTNKWLSVGSNFGPFVHEQHDGFVDIIGRESTLKTMPKYETEVNALRTIEALNEFFGKFTLEDSKPLIVAI